MNKADLIKNLSKSMNVPSTTAKELLENFSGIMTAELIGGGAISLPGIGKLVSKNTQPVKRRNPQTGEIINIPARKKVFFRPGKDLKAALK